MNLRHHRDTLLAHNERVSHEGPLASHAAKTHQVAAQLTPCVRVQLLHLSNIGRNCTRRSNVGWTLCDDMKLVNSMHCWCQVCEHAKCSCHACTCNAIAYAPAAAGNRFSKEGARRECVELITQAWTKDSQTCNVNLKFDERLASLGHYERNV